MEAAIEKNTNDELKTLQLKLSILEEELRKSMARAELAENELEKYKRQEMAKNEPLTLPVLPPPPPPPMPVHLLYKAPGACGSSSSSSMTALQDSSFSDRIALHNLHTTKSNDIGGGQKVIDTVKQQVQPEAATGRFICTNNNKSQQRHQKHTLSHRQ